MKYAELYQEYKTYLSQYTEWKKELSILPKGNLLKKCISGREYNYLQYTSFGKRKTEYIKKTDFAEIQKKITRREELQTNLHHIIEELTRLEQAVLILDPQMSKTFMILKQCADMDALPLYKRKDALSFSNAMTALEGLEARSETIQNLNAWANGMISFSDFYIPVLEMYHVMEENHG